MTPLGWLLTFGLDIPGTLLWGELARVTDARVVCSIALRILAS